MTSLWLAETRNATEIYGGATHDVPNAEVVVVGAGITGLVTAVLLSRGGSAS
jgi:ribulose 1,5-bisphosphate synthetase/thiazole synthase